MIYSIEKPAQLWAPRAPPWVRSGPGDPPEPWWRPPRAPVPRTTTPPTCLSKGTGSAVYVEAVRLFSFSWILVIFWDGAL